MNIDAYNLDSLRALVRKLEKENQNLKQKVIEKCKKQKYK